MTKIEKLRRQVVRAEQAFDSHAGWRSRYPWWLVSIRILLTEIDRLAEGESDG